ncbi:PepSY domain-containing protein [Moheibacter lacus]|uniref:NADPH--hemoprotein reductase n=1 Tax=Moheibacter lacus TaxID=2745851 RepID=A0A838ZKA3_9FLAO|nr:PepSY domain-containing protein [Moheibacter lacus]MBA5628804.1 PepSY domain-containing protein [Moheibacter lacus]
MTLSIWRLSHLALALVSCLFLMMASATGVILAWDPIQEKSQPYKVDGFDEITIAASIPELQKQYSEIIELSVDKNQFVTLKGFDEDGNDFEHYIHPISGEILGKPIVKSEIIQWTTALHRSLFLKETGRFLVGIVSFLLMLIVISGTILIIKRQHGILKFFDKINKEYFAQYFHVIAGRLLLLPIFIVAITGTYLFMIRFEWIPNPEIPAAEMGEIMDRTDQKIPKNEFEIFQLTKLSEVEKIEFPFMEDPEEFFKIKLKDRELILDQFTGEILHETHYPKTKVWETLSLDLHTGRTNSIWAVVLGIASLNILFFIYSGFVIALKRKSIKIKNKFNAKNAEFILLFGSEGGTTLNFANQVHKQLLENGHSSFLTELNQYKSYPKAKQIMVFTSTYGQGDAPSNASKFRKLLNKYPQKQQIKFSVIGFGSKSYKHFCGYAEKVDNWFEGHSWSIRHLDLMTVNDKSPNEFVEWIKIWSAKNQIALANAPSLYASKLPKLKKLKVISEQENVKSGDSFSLLFKTKEKFKSGDLLAVYPDNDHRERFYSIGKFGKDLKLIVKLHELGLGSNYLHDLKNNESIQARIIKNTHFHFPKKAKKIALIANGTGIAPFLGMIDENSKKKETHLYAGFRFHNDLVRSYEKSMQKQIENHKLTSLNLAFSREENPAYVMDLVRRDADFFAELLEKKGVIMICGSLAMQRDVESVLEEICQEKLNRSFEIFKRKGQLKTDCY